MTNDLDRDLRELFRRHEADLLGREEYRAPTDITPRVRRRQVRSVLVVALATAVMIAGTTAGVGALLRASEGRPADPPSPTPSPSPVTLLPPTDASIAVGTGSAGGWDWLLSTSADGTCVALTDAQGSETTCADLPTRGRPENRVTTAVWSPGPPAPSVLFVFGRVPAETAQVSIHTSRYEGLEGELIAPPDGVGFDGRFYVGWLAGYEHPFVPGVYVSALDDADEVVGWTWPLFERPDWASEPTGTVIEVLGSGKKVAAQGDNAGEAVTFEIAIFTDHATGQVCLGEIAGTAMCGPADAPGPAWEAAIASYCELPNAYEQSCTWPLSVQDVGVVAHGKEILAASWGWGLAKEPIVAVRAERSVFSGPDVSSERDGWVDADVVDLPAEYGASFKVWIYSCDDCLTGPTVGFDAEGNEIARLFGGGNG